MGHGTVPCPRYFAYLWFSDSNSLVGTPIYYQNDKIEIGQRTGFMFSKISHVAEIPLSIEPFDASEVYSLITNAQ